MSPSCYFQAFIKFLRSTSYPGRATQTKAIKNCFLPSERLDNTLFGRLYLPKMATISIIPISLLQCNFVNPSTWGLIPHVLN